MKHREISSEIEKIAKRNVSNKTFFEIKEYLDYNELGIAFEILCEEIREFRIQVSDSDYKKIEEIGGYMGELISPTWKKL